jgi:hypothetical protein
VPGLGTVVGAIIGSIVCGLVGGGLIGGAGYLIEKKLSSPKQESQPVDSVPLAPKGNGKGNEATKNIITAVRASAGPPTAPTAAQPSVNQNSSEVVSFPKSPGNRSRPLSF